MIFLPCVKMHAGFNELLASFLNPTASTSLGIRRSKHPKRTNNKNVV